MAKEYIRLNNNNEHLSLGNILRIIKEMAKNKQAALQTEVFCTLFNIDSINDTTVNNYCLGARSIGSDYKQIYINMYKKYPTNKKIFTDVIINLLCIIDGVIYDIKNNEIDFINKNNSTIELSKKLYNLAKNDNDVDNDTINELKKLLDSNNYYECLVKELVFAILDKKQPIYETDLKREVIENILSDTSISSKSLEEYLSLKLKEGINYDLTMKKLASTGNAYANFELGSNEYYGYVKGYPRYNEAYKYFLNASLLHHPGACYMLGRMLVNGNINKKSNNDLERGYEYLKEASNLGSIAALNMLGTMYKDGIYPLKKDVKKAKELFIKASDNNYAYAYNNLGQLYEEEKKIDEAFTYYLKSANLGESWACNKVGLYYWNNNDVSNAYKYWLDAIEANYHTVCYYAYYNLAINFYLYGCNEIAKDEGKAIEYLKLASIHNIEEATKVLKLLEKK